MFDYDKLRVKAAGMIANYGGTATISTGTESYNPITDTFTKTDAVTSINLVLTERQVKLDDGRVVNQRIARVSTIPSKLALTFAGALPTGATFSRASVALNGALQTVAIDQPRYSGDGIMVEPASTNWLRYSHDYANAYWSKTGVTLTAGQIAPDGSTTATAIVPTVPSGISRILSPSFSLSGSTVTYSVYTKALGYNFAYVLLTDGVSRFGGYVDLTSGATSLVSGATVSVIDAGSGWYRVTVTRAWTAALLYCAVHPVPSSGSYVFAGDGVSGCLVWGAQLETNAQATSLIATTGTEVTRAADSLSLDWSEQNYPDGAQTGLYTLSDASVVSVAGTVAGGRMAVPALSLPLRSATLAGDPTLELSEQFVGATLTTGDGARYTVEAVETVKPTGTGQPIIYTLVLS